MKKIFSVFALSLLVVACGDKTAVSTVQSVPSVIDGTFLLENGKETLTFTKAGEVTYKHPQYSTKVTNYKLQESEISFQFKEGYMMKMTVVDDSHLKSIVGGTYVKQ